MALIEQHLDAMALAPTELAVPLVTEDGNAVLCESPESPDADLPTASQNSSDSDCY